MAEASEIRQRGRRSMLVLGARSALQELTVALGTLALARLLEPAAFGTFAIVQFVLALFRTIGDVGFAPSLIQQKEPPTARELSTVFWFQLGAALTVVGAVWLLADLLLWWWPALPPEATQLLRVLSLSLLMTMMGVVPTLLLERDLRFVPLSVVDLVGTVGFYGSAVALALTGLGAEAFVGAALARSGLVLLGVYWARPWRPRFEFSVDALRRIVPFGLFFQGKNILGVVNDAVTPALAGGLLGQVALGLNNFGRQTASFPLHVVGIIGRVSFPLFSRLTADPSALVAELNFSLRLCGTVTVGFSVLFLSLGPALVELVYHPKWLPALNALYIYSLALNLGFMAPIVAGAFEGLGRPQVVLRLSVAWTLLNWLVVVPALWLKPTLEVFACAYVVHMILGNLGLLLLLRRELPGVRAVSGWIRSAGVGVLVVVATRTLLANYRLSLWTLLPAVLAVVGGWFLLSMLADTRLRKAVFELARRLRKRPQPT